MSSSEEIIVQELKSEDFLDVVRSFLDILRSCMGPKGSIKILVSSGNVSVATSSSSRLLNYSIFSHPVCILVSQVMKSQTKEFGDYGLYSGVLTLNLLERILKQNIIKQSRASEVIHILSSRMRFLLESDSAKLKLDFSTVKQLLPIVKSIVSSKPGCGLNKLEIENLSIQIVKVFLNTVHDDFGDVILVNSIDITGTRIINGILYQIDVEEEFVLKFVHKTAKQYNGALALLLFDIMLTNTKTERNEIEKVTADNEDILKQATRTFEYAVKIGVKIIACQKVVHNSLRLLLQRNDVLLLDRLGTDLCKAVEKMSGAKPVSAIGNNVLPLLKARTGSVDSVKCVKHGHRSYIVLEKNNSNTATLLMQCLNEQAYAELKIVTQQALTALRQVTYHPFVLPGAGCLETWLATQLREQDLCEIGDKKLKRTVIGWLQASLLSIAGVFDTSTTFLSVDTAYCHSWNSWDPDEEACCHCGLVLTSDVKTAGGNWMQPSLFAINDMVFPLSLKTVFPLAVPKKIYENSVVDLYVSKYNALKLALDTCINILNIGIIVHKSHN